MDLLTIQGAIHYIPGVTNIGVICGRDGQSVLVDTGTGDRSGRLVLRLLEKHGLHPVAILNTHAHGDHIGGNAYIVEQTGARVYAPTLDSVILEQPAWGTVCVFLGAEPLPELEVPRYAPRPCPVDVMVEEGAYEIAGLTVQAIPLPGHTGSHTGYLVDGVLFLGDALAGPRQLEASRICYLYSVTRQLASLQRLQALRCLHYLPGHEEPHIDISHLLAQNLERIQGVLHVLREELARGPCEASDLLAALCDRYEISSRHIRDHLLLHATLHSYLGHLYRCREVAFDLEGARLRWFRASTG